MYNYVQLIKTYISKLVCTARFWKKSASGDAHSQMIGQTNDLKICESM